MTSTIKPKAQKKCAQYASMPLFVREKNMYVCLRVHKFYLNNICHQGWDLMAPEQADRTSCACYSEPCEFCVLSIQKCTTH